MRFGCDTEPLDKCPLCEDKVLRSMMERHLQRKHKKSLDQVSSKAIDEVPRHQNEEPINVQSKQASPIVQEQAGGSASAPDTCSASAEPRAIPSDRRQASGHVVVKCDLCGAEVRADRLNRHKKAEAQRAHKKLPPEAGRYVLESKRIVRGSGIVPTVRSENTETRYRETY